MRLLVAIISTVLFSTNLWAQTYSGSWDQVEVNEQGRWVLTLNGKPYQAASHIAVRYKSVLLPISEVKEFPLRVKYEIEIVGNVAKVARVVVEQTIDEYENLNH